MGNIEKVVEEEDSNTLEWRKLVASKGKEILTSIKEVFTPKTSATTLKSEPDQVAYKGLMAGKFVVTSVEILSSILNKYSSKGKEIGKVGNFIANLSDRKAEEIVQELFTIGALTLKK